MKAGKLYSCIATLIQMLCVVGVLLFKNPIVDLCIIGFQALLLCVQCVIYFILKKKYAKNISK
jgi:ABC-type bacteriocin/lantibiotic exporter with double-glycine peptidase domain